jgi:HEAT repeat protein
MTPDQRQRTISSLNGRTQTDAFEAAKAIWQDPDRRLERRLLATLRSGRRPFNRAAAAFAMQILKTPRTIRALERTVKSSSENPRVRGEAAEALAHGHRRRSHDVLLKYVKDRSKEVRFWCAFALGEMADKRAIPSLELIAGTDKRVVRGFHSVAREARDALHNIESGNLGHRRNNGCVFCVRRASR